MDSDRFTLRRSTQRARTSFLSILWPQLVRYATRPHTNEYAVLLSDLIRCYETNYGALGAPHTSFTLQLMIPDGTVVVVDKEHNNVIFAWNERISFGPEFYVQRTKRVITHAAPLETALWTLELPIPILSVSTDVLHHIFARYLDFETWLTLRVTCKRLCGVVEGVLRSTLPSATASSLPPLQRHLLLRGEVPWDSEYLTNFVLNPSHRRVVEGWFPPDANVEIRYPRPLKKRRRRFLKWSVDGECYTVMTRSVPENTL